LRESIFPGVLAIPLSDNPPTHSLAKRISSQHLNLFPAACMSFSTPKQGADSDDNSMTNRFDKESGAIASGQINSDRVTLSGGNHSGQSERRTVQVAMDPQLTTIQPGGGIVMSIELGWGYLRRWYLRKFRSGYVQRMSVLRQGTRGILPFVPIDQRDVKFYRNQDTYWWPESDDDFRWRDSLPFARAGLAELVLISGLFLFIALVLGLLWWPLCLPPLVVFALVVWFFRNPPREIPTGHGVVVSPADGKLVEIVEIEDPDIGPAIRFGIFLSIFNVHINRSSMSGAVVAVRYRPGKFLNALRPESARENENLDVILASHEMPGQFFRIRQITGQFARRIVCWVRPGDVLTRGEQFGMIKLGSRTELVIPRHDALKIEIAIGDKVSAGLTRLAHYGFDATLSGSDHDGATGLQSLKAGEASFKMSNNRESGEERTDG